MPGAVLRGGAGATQRSLPQEPLGRGGVFSPRSLGEVGGGGGGQGGLAKATLLSMPEQNEGWVLPAD